MHDNYFTPLEPITRKLRSVVVTKWTTSSRSSRRWFQCAMPCQGNSTSWLSFEWPYNISKRYVEVNRRNHIFWNSDSWEYVKLLFYLLTAVHSYTEGLHKVNILIHRGRLVKRISELLNFKMCKSTFYSFFSPHTASIFFRSRNENADSPGSRGIPFCRRLWPRSNSLCFGVCIWGAELFTSWLVRSELVWHSPSERWEAYNRMPGCSSALDLDWSRSSQSE